LVLALLMGPAAAQQRLIPLSELRSGLSYAGADVRALQADEFGNPAQLWLMRGEQRWSEAVGAAGKSCQSCHGTAGDSMRGVAARYPALERSSGQLMNLEDRVRQCRTQRQQGPELAFESDDLLALSLYVTQASAGMALQVDISGAALAHWQQGERLFMQRRGQLNLACTHCQGQPNGYPLFRMEWQKVGSLERRLRSCLVGVRAQVPPWGALEMRQLALYLGWRGQGLAIEAPAVRK
jgi:sulfur-oxidizing protein SoxA